MFFAMYCGRYFESVHEMNESTKPAMFFAMYCGRYFESVHEMPFSLIESVMPSSVPSISQPYVSKMVNVPLGARPGAKPWITLAAQPSAKMAWRIASLMLSSNVVCTDEISTQQSSAALPGCDAA